MLRSGHLFIKRSALSLFCLVCTCYYVYSQTVDSIRLEQSGDLIKVHYKILDSKPDQIFRVSVLCSINGGLRSQLNSLSGDFGDNVTGGRSDYLILWDVLKDVEELTSAEFFIKAEMVRDLSINLSNNSGRSKSKAKFHLLPGFQVPGPKGGLRVGYSGNFGVSVMGVMGKIPVTEQFKDEDNQGRTSSPSISLDLTKRIVSSDSLQIHLMAGFTNHDIYFYWPGTPSLLWTEGEDGAEAGILIAYKRIATAVIFSHYFASKIENGTELAVASPVNCFSFCLGISF